MTSKSKAPVLFISHGAPTFAIEPGVLGPRLGAIGGQLSDLRAVLVVSPHWQTRDVKVMASAKPETVHDFGGFPSGLYTLRPCKSLMAASPTACCPWSRMSGECPGKSLASVINSERMDVDFLYYGDIGVSQVFWKREIVSDFWGRYFEILEITDPPENSFQDWVICKKVGP